MFWKPSSTLSALGPVICQSSTKVHIRMLGRQASRYECSERFMRNMPQTERGSPSGMPHDEAIGFPTHPSIWNILLIPTSALCHVVHSCSGSPQSRASAKMGTLGRVLKHFDMSAQAPAISEPP